MPVFTRFYLSVPELYSRIHSLVIICSQNINSFNNPGRGACPSAHFTAEMPCRGGALSPPVLPGSLCFRETGRDIPQGRPLGRLFPQSHRATGRRTGPGLVPADRLPAGHPVGEGLCPLPFSRALRAFGRRDKARFLGDGQSPLHTCIKSPDRTRQKNLRDIRRGKPVRKPLRGEEAVRRGR